MKTQNYIKLLLPLVLCFLFTATVFAQVDTSIKVYDYIGVLSEDEIPSISAKANDILTRQQSDVVIVIADTTDGKTSTEYADDFFDYNNFGYGEKQSGLLLLVNMQDREMWISTKGYAISVFNDSIIDDILDSITDAVVAEDYFTMSLQFLYEVDRYISLTEGPLPERDLLLRERYPTYIIAFGSIGIGLLVSAVVMLIILLAHKSSFPKAPVASLYVADDSFNLTAKEDIFLRTHTTKTPIPKDNGSGGSSTHKSSSGSSHGGGGKKF